MTASVVARPDAPWNFPTARARRRLLAHSLPGPPAPRPRLPRRLPVSSRAAPAAARRARPAPDPALSRSRRLAGGLAGGRLPPGPQPLLARRLGRVLESAAWAGVALSIPVLVGFANGLLMAVLWALYISFVHVGQDFYGFGWEIQLLETGFLASSSARSSTRVRSRAGRRRERHLAAALAHLPDHARRGPDQAARRSVLARPHLPRSTTTRRSRSRTRSAARSISCRTGCTASASSSTTSRSWSRPGSSSARAARGRRGRADGGVPAHPDRERQPVVPELADAGARPRLLRRRLPGAASCRARLVRASARGAATAVPGARSGSSPGACWRWSRS